MGGGEVRYFLPAMCSLPFSLFGLALILGSKGDFGMLLTGNIACVTGVGIALMFVALGGLRR